MDQENGEERRRKEKRGEGRRVEEKGKQESKQDGRGEKKREKERRARSVPSTPAALQENTAFLAQIPCSLTTPESGQVVWGWCWHGTMKR